MGQDLEQELRKRSDYLRDNVEETGPLNGTGNVKNPLLEGLVGSVSSRYPTARTAEDLAEEVSKEGGKEK